LTLYTTPVIYIFFDNLANWFAHGRKKNGNGGADGDARREVTPA
jgi:hypothetical protein